MLVQKKDDENNEDHKNNWFENDGKKPTAKLPRDIEESGRKLKENRGKQDKKNQNKRQAFNHVIPQLSAIRRLFYF